MIERSPAILPPTWIGPAGVYGLSVESVDSWHVSLGDEAVGTLVDVSDDSGPRWTIRVAGNDNAGVGSSWATWEEALIDLADFQETIAS